MVKPRRHRVAMLAYPDAQILDVVGPLEVFARTSRWLDETGHDAPLRYEVEVVAPDAGPVTMSSGLELVAARSYRQLRNVDTLLVAGGIGYRAAIADPAMMAWLRRKRDSGVRMASIRTGAFLLAEAGLLTGGRATTHWDYCDQLAARFPEVRVEPDAIYVENDGLWTSAGVTAGLDLALALVEEDLGRDVALAVARQLVLFLRRPGGQSQFSAALDAEAGAHRFHELQIWILGHLDADLSVERLAERMSMSPRNFARAFLRETGSTPGRFVQKARVEAARGALQDSDASLEQIAGQFGFGTTETLRRTFLRHLKVAPNDYRRRFRPDPG